jgi:hypothetical protein
MLISLCAVFLGIIINRYLATPFYLKLIQVVKNAI